MYICPHAGVTSAMSPERKSPLESSRAFKLNDARALVSQVTCFGKSTDQRKKFSVFAPRYATREWGRDVPFRGAQRWESSRSCTSSLMFALLFVVDGPPPPTFDQRQRRRKRNSPEHPKIIDAPLRPALHGVSMRGRFWLRTSIGRHPSYVTVDICTHTVAPNQPISRTTFPLPCTSVRMQKPRAC
jgi:hypothetical protein